MAVVCTKRLDSSGRKLLTGRPTCCSHTSWYRYQSILKQNQNYHFLSLWFVCMINYCAVLFAAAEVIQQQFTAARQKVCMKKRGLSRRCRDLAASNKKFKTFYLRSTCVTLRTIFSSLCIILPTTTSKAEAFPRFQPTIVHVTSVYMVSV